jgi:hypothetical protein
VRCRAHAALTLWWLGYSDQALHRSHEALTLAQEVAHPLSLAFALCFAAWLHQFRREERLAQEQAEAGIALATEHGFTVLLAQGTIFRGWALAEQAGEPEAGQGQREEGSPRCGRAWRSGAPQGHGCFGRMVWPARRGSCANRSDRGGAYPPGRSPGGGT